jgi:hypothetical protein
MKPNWKILYFGHVSAEEVRHAVKDIKWQEIRKSMKGKSLEDKYLTLCSYYADAVRTSSSWQELRLAQVRVTNYVTALSRGGLIKPEDYKCKGGS